MKKHDKFVGHPEIIELVNICSISPNDPSIKDICDKLHHDRMMGTKKRHSSKRR